MNRPIAVSTIGLVLSAVLTLANTVPATAAERVDLELVIATDVSRSIDDQEALLQREGVAAAFRSPEVIRAIQSGFSKKIAVAYIDYSSRAYNEIIVPWRIIDGPESAESFAKALLSQPLTFGRRTSISGALEMAAEMIESNDIQGFRRVIDIAGDGPNNFGRLVDEVRDEVLRKGISINGLPIINDNGGPGSRFHLPDLDKYYTGCVIGGAGAFIVVARDFKDFARAIRRKLIFEIADLAPVQVAEHHPLLLPVQARQFGAPQAEYEKGCDVGERLWERIWNNPDNY